MKKKKRTTSSAKPSEQVTVTRMECANAAAAQALAVQVQNRVIQAALKFANIPCQSSDDMPGYYRTPRRLGSGSFGDVELMFRFVGKGQWRAMAVKRIDLFKYNLFGAAIIMVFDAGKEVALSRRGQQCPHVLAIEEAWYDPRSRAVHLAMDAGDDNLLNYVVIRHRCALPPLFLLSICAQCAFALQHLHRVGVVHRDVKPGNFIINASAEPSKPPMVRLIDFGLSAAVDDPRVARCHVGTVEFMAPELFAHSSASFFSPTAPDVWSLGVTFYFLAVGELPQLRVVDGALRVLAPYQNVFGQPITAEVMTVLKLASAMLEYQPAARPSMDVIVHAICTRFYAPPVPAFTTPATVRRTHVGSPGVRRQVYGTDEVGIIDTHHTLAELSSGATVFVRNASRPPSPQQWEFHSLPPMTSYALAHRMFAEPSLRCARSVQLHFPTHVHKPPWLCMVYPHYGFCKAFFGRKQTLRFEDVDMETYVTYSRNDSTNAASASEATALTWKWGNTPHGPLWESSAFDYFASTLVFQFTPSVPVE